MVTNAVRLAPLLNRYLISSRLVHSECVCRRTAGEGHVSEGNAGFSPTPAVGFGRNLGDWFAFD